MKISTKNRELLVDAVFNNITDLRIKFRAAEPHPCGISQNQLDDELFKLQGKIWKGISEILKFQA